ncbi:MAG: hypothetical protein KBC30_07155 [Planctomycetes bacterium]|nr:hypothetical protein [Planctomycetota bacterium]HPY75543.1 hypothetical protein [Planctomycetota bacterium]HRU52510.1 hypothetical protein [Planctomycetota bacterium]
MLFFCLLCLCLCFATSEPIVQQFDDICNLMMQAECYSGIGQELDGCDIRQIRKKALEYLENHVVFSPDLGLLECFNEAVDLFLSVNEQKQTDAEAWARNILLQRYQYSIDIWGELQRFLVVFDNVDVEIRNQWLYNFLSSSHAFYSKEAPFVLWQGGVSFLESILGFETYLLIKNKQAQIKFQPKSQSMVTESNESLEDAKQKMLDALEKEKIKSMEYMLYLREKSRDSNLSQEEFLNLIEKSAQWFQQEMTKQQKKEDQNIVSSALNINEETLQKISEENNDSLKENEEILQKISEENNDSLKNDEFFWEEWTRSFHIYHELIMNFIQKRYCFYGNKNLAQQLRESQEYVLQLHSLFWDDIERMKILWGKFYFMVNNSEVAEAMKQWGIWFVEEKMTLLFSDDLSVQYKTLREFSKILEKYDNDEERDWAVAMLEKHGILQGSLEKQFQVAYSLAYTSDILPFVHQSSIEQSSLQKRAEQWALSLLQYRGKLLEDVPLLQQYQAAVFFAMNQFQPAKSYEEAILWSKHWIEIVRS